MRRFFCPTFEVSNNSLRGERLQSAIRGSVRVGLRGFASVRARTAAVRTMNRSECVDLHDCGEIESHKRYVEGHSAAQYVLREDGERDETTNEEEVASRGDGDARRQSSDGAAATAPNVQFLQSPHNGHCCSNVTNDQYDGNYQ